MPLETQARSYKVDLSLTNPRTLRLKRDAATKIGDLSLAAAFELRLAFLNKKTNQHNRKSNHVYRPSKIINT